MTSKRSWSYIRLYDDVPEDITDLQQGEIISVRNTAELFLVVSQSPLTLIEIGGGQGSGIPSDPPSGKYKVTNIYFDLPVEEEVVQYNETPVP